MDRGTGREEKVKVGAYIGWLGHSNIGDEACMLAVESFIKDSLQLIGWDIAPWRRKNYPDICILGGGTLLDIRYGRREKSLLDPMFKKRIPIVTWGTGVLDLFGSKINPRVMEILNWCKYVGVRGPISKRILEKRGFKYSNIIGDPALFLSTEKHKVVKDSRIGINVGYTNNRLYGSEKQVIVECKKSIEILKSNGFDIILFSMWPRDNKMLDIISEGKVKVRYMTKFKKGLRETTSLLDFLGTCDCVIGMKLHSCVLSAAIGTPFISLAYRLKCIDFVKSLGNRIPIYRTDESWSNNIEKSVKFVLNNKKEIMDKMNFIKAKYKRRHLALKTLVTNNM